MPQHCCRSPISTVPTSTFAVGLFRSDHTDHYGTLTHTRTLGIEIYRRLRGRRRSCFAAHVAVAVAAYVDRLVELVAALEALLVGLVEFAPYRPQIDQRTGVVLLFCLVVECFADVALVFLTV